MTFVKYKTVTTLGATSGHGCKRFPPVFQVLQCSRQITDESSLMNKGDDLYLDQNECSLKKTTIDRSKCDA